MKTFDGDQKGAALKRTRADGEKLGAKIAESFQAVCASGFSSPDVIANWRSSVASILGTGKIMMRRAGYPEPLITEWQAACIRTFRSLIAGQIGREQMIALFRLTGETHGQA